MKIKDLKTTCPLVFKAALANQKRQGLVITDDVEMMGGNTDVPGDFNFSDTPEGWGFWDSIRRGWFPEARKEIPELFRDYGNSSDLGTATLAEIRLKCIELAINKGGNIRTISDDIKIAIDIEDYVFRDPS